jgi:hypothetical protein
MEAFVVHFQLYLFSLAHFEAFQACIRVARWKRRPTLLSIWPRYRSCIAQSFRLSCQFPIRRLTRQDRLSIRCESGTLTRQAARRTYASPSAPSPPLLDTDCTMSISSTSLPPSGVPALRTRRSVAGDARMGVAPRRGGVPSLSIGA